MHPVGFAQTDVGRTRDQNEDALFADDGLGLYVVCDGMGGHAAGEVASATAIETVVAEVRAQRPLLVAFQRGRAGGDAVTALVREAIAKACARVHAMANAAEERAGMGCTLTMLLVLGGKAAIGHVGDSRLYMVRQGKTSQLTTDHSMANELALAGLIRAEEVRDHQYAHVLTRAIGTQPTVSADVLLMDVVPGDRFILCSDGLADHVEQECWLGDETDGVALSDVPGMLVDFANQAGGHDNVSVIAVGIEPDDPEIEIVDEMSTEVYGKFEALGAVFLFEGLSVAMLARVLDACEVTAYGEGDVVHAAGAPCEQLYVVLDGAFRLGDGAGARDLGPGAHVGATTLLAPRAARAPLAAKEPSRLLVLRREPFWALVKARPWLGVGLLDRLGRRLGADLDGSDRDAI